MTAHRDELGVVCAHGQLERVCPLCELTAERDALAELACRTTHHLACECREAEFAAKDKRIAELETRIRQYERWCEDAEPRMDALSALVEEMRDWMEGADESPDFWAGWLARARAALGEGQ